MTSYRDDSPDVMFDRASAYQVRACGARASAEVPRSATVTARGVDYDARRGQFAPDPYAGRHLEYGRAGGAASGARGPSVREMIDAARDSVNRAGRWVEDRVLHWDDKLRGREGAILASDRAREGYIGRGDVVGSELSLLVQRDSGGLDSA